MFRGRVEAGRRLVEHEHERLLAQHRPAERELLPLPARDVDTVGEGSTELRVEARRQLVHQGGAAGAIERGDDSTVVLEPGQVPDAHGLAGEQFEGDEVLEGGGESRRLQASASISRRSTPSTSTDPSVGSYMPVSSFTSGVFPAPFSPTTAIVVPAGIMRSISRRTGRSPPR